MTRVRISTTIDRQRLDHARRLLSVRDSELIDAALAALIEREENERELRALERLPYDLDDDLTPAPLTLDWDVALPYDGEVPADVIELARARRERT